MRKNVLYRKTVNTTKDEEKEKLENSLAIFLFSFFFTFSLFLLLQPFLLVTEFIRSDEE